MVRVLFLHPDLGIGGAERFVVDAALALKEKGHEAFFLTNHHDHEHCFDETINGSFRVTVIGKWLPRKIFGRFYALCAYVRMLYAAFYTSFYLSHQERVDVVICDQIPIGIPVLRLAKNRPRILFYCHFPDQLLSPKGSILKTLYRAPINWLEEITMGMSDKTLVNSKYTLRVFRETFRRLDIIPDVLYPSLNTDTFDAVQSNMAATPMNKSLLPTIDLASSFIFLDINRYERKKNHCLALNAFKLLADVLAPSEWKHCYLIVAGGYDTRTIENIQHYKELKQLTEKLDLQDNVVFLKSPGDKDKLQLLNAAHCLLYTPENEHFGIVPLEGMYMAKPVIAINSGGPTETIVPHSTGFLCKNEMCDFADAMLQLYKDDALRQRMGEMGRKRVEQKFSFQVFADKLNDIIENVLVQNQQEVVEEIQKKDN